MSNYRVLVTYDPEKSVFVARAPELEHCSGEGATRPEALTKLEEEIDAQLRNMREQGARPPAAVDENSSLAGELTAKVSRTLHRDLAFQARSEGVELGQLVGEMLAAGLVERRQHRRASPQSVQQPQDRGDQQPRQDRQDRGPRRDGGNRAPGAPGGRYHAIMDNSANFIEYVRGLEQGRGPGPGPGGPRRSRGPGGPGGRPGSGRNDGGSQGGSQGGNEGP